MNSKVGIFSILLFGIITLFIPTSSFSMVNAQEYNDYYNDNKANFAELERFDDKLFVCDNGIVVDDRTQCPLKCPFGTTLDGVYVMDMDICTIESETMAQECGPDTDMPGVLAMNQDQCNIFATCDADSPLGSALNTLEPLKVADIQLCQLNIPGMAICDSGFLEGFVVDDESVCDTALNDVSVCGPTSDVAGMLTVDQESCNLFTTCDANSNLGEALGNTPITVVDEELCNLVIPEETQLFQCDLDTPMGGAIVTDPSLCQAPNDNNKCPAGTDLEGTYVMNTASDCSVFATCDAGTKLGIALNMQNEFKVSDPVLCDLEVPPATELFVCTEDADGPMSGAIVTDLSLCQAPNNNNKCPDNSDLPGVYVMDPQTQCEITYDICDASTPLGQALGLGAADTVEVADGTLCFLSVPEAVQLFECEAEDTLGAGALVTDQQLCNALVQEVAQCEDGPLQGVFVSPEDAATTCTLEDVVTNCPISVDNPMSGQLVTTVLLCNAPVDAEKCPAQNDDLSPTDLPGVYTMMPSQCNIDYPVCDSTTPLGIALDLGVTEEVEVVDDAICQLDIPILLECIESGFLVNDPANCPTKCPDGRYVMQGMECTSPPPQSNPLTVTKNWFVCDSDNTDIDCTTSTFNKQSTEPPFETQLSNSYIQCSSEEECQFTSDANLEIEVSGNNPMPTNIDALVGTMQDVNIDNGQYSVSEILEGQQEPFISKFDRLDVGNSPVGVAYAQDKMLMYVTNTNDNTVTILDTAGGTDNTVGNADDVLGTVVVGNNPRGVAYAQDKMLMYVTNTNDNTVTILDTAGGTDNTVGNADDVVGTVDVGNFPQGVAYAQDKMLMYITNADDIVTILDTAGGTDNTVGNADDVVGTVAVGDLPLGIAYAQDKMLMYVTNVFDDTVTILDTAGGTDNTVGTPDDVVGTVAVGDLPRGVAHAQDKMLMYVTNTNDNTVTILDTAGGTDNTVGNADDVVGTVAVGNSPEGVAHAQDKMLMYVTNTNDNTVTILDTAGGTDNTVGNADDVVGTVAVNDFPRGVAHAQDKMLMYVVNTIDDTVTILDTAGGTDNTVGNADDVVNPSSLKLAIGDSPRGVAHAQDKMLMYVVNTIDDTVTILDTAGGTDNTVGNADDVVGTVDVGNFPLGVAYAQDKMLMYVTNADDNTVTILDTAGGTDNTVGNADDVVGTVDVGNFPLGVAYAQDKMLMYVTNTNDNTVTILDTAGGTDNTVGNADDVVGTVDVGIGPEGVAYAQDKMLMYVTNADDNTVTILDTAGGTDNTVGNVDDVLGTVDVGIGPEGVAYAQDKMLMYVTNADDNTVTILDTAGGTDNTVGNVDDVLGTVDVGNFPRGVAYAQDKMLMYVVNAFDDTITILDTAGGTDNTVGNADDVVGTVAVGNNPLGVAYAQDKMLIYVTNTSDDTVSVISIPTIEQACQNSGFDTGDKRTYQSNDGQNIEQITCVNFSEQCTGDIVKESTEIQQCVIDDYAVIVNELS